MSTRQSNYLSFLLRLWRATIDQETIWRKSLQDSLNGEQVNFSNLDDLFAFLRQLTMVADDKGQNEGGVE